MKSRKIGFVLIIVGVLLMLTFSACAPASSTVSAPSPSQSLPATTSATAPAQSVPASSTSSVRPAEAWSPDGVIKPGEYSGSQVYDKLSVSWRLDGQYICIGLAAATGGWVAMALQPGLRMQDADMVMGFVKDGKVEILDLYCTDNFGNHPQDTELGGSADIAAFSGSEKEGATTIEFKRLLATGDKYDIDITPGINKILWSYGAGDSSSQKHTAKGYGEMDVK